MSEADAVAAVLWVGATLYAVFGGADFGAGFWSLTASREEKGEKARSLIDRAIGPVWEANHVWLIFILVVLWTAFSAAFESIMSTLFIPLSLAALGIVLRGAGFAFHETADRAGARRFAELPVRGLVGDHAVLHGHRRGRDSCGASPGGQCRRRPRLELAESRLGHGRSALRRHRRLPGGSVPGQRRAPLRRRRPRELLPRQGHRPPRSSPARSRSPASSSSERTRATSTTGSSAKASPSSSSRPLCGLGALALLWRAARRGARELAVGAVVAIIWGWGVAQYPYLLPTDLTIAAGAGTDATHDDGPDRLRRCSDPRDPVDRAALHAHPAQRPRVRGRARITGR